MKSLPEYPQKIWRIKTPTPALCQILARKLGISPLTAQLLVNRGIYTVEQGRDFLDCQLERLHSPLLLTDMKKSVERVLKAVGEGEKILVYGDYDADGITATALLVQVFRRLGADVSYYVPNRLAEGYGLHLEALQKAREIGTSLVVTVDCGISSVGEAFWAKENGLDLIITDHHEPPPEIPGAFAVINPKRPDCKYPFKELAGVGVALKLAQVLLERAGEGSDAWLEYMDLACLGTIADIVACHGENRILIKHGLPRLANTGSPGLQALMAVSGVNRDDLGPREVGFGLAPRLNAAGRIGSPDLAVKLLLTDNMGEAWELASELNQGNQTRQKIESALLEDALKLLEENPGLEKDRVLVLASESWHPGVIGIVASRLMDRFYRPVLLIAVEGDEGKGSARSIPCFNIHRALAHCEKQLLEYGGHAQAAGFSIKTGSIEDFRREINLYAGGLIDDGKMIPQLDLDGIIEIDQVTEELINEIKMLSPFGHENPDPLLGCRKAMLLESRGVGKGAAHLKLRLRGENGSLDGIAFNLGAYAEVLATAEAVDLAFVPDINEYKGRRTVQLKVRDLGIPAALAPVEREIQPSPLLGKSCFTPAGELSGGYEDLFVPEFVLRTLKNLKLTDQGQDIGEKSVQNNQMIDCRGEANRPALLAQLTGEGEPALVVASCGYQTVELTHYLQLSMPALRGKTAFCHAGTSGEMRSELVALFETGKIKTMVVTPAMAQPFGNYARQLLLYHLPHSPETIRRAINIIKPDGRMYLLFSQRDLEDNLASLEALAPDRAYLACLYQLLRREVNGRTEIDFNLTRAARALTGSGYPHSKEYTVRVALAILGELGLIASNAEGKTVRVKLYPAPPEKKDLREAPTFKRLQLIKQESITWMRKLLFEPVHTLFNL